MMIFREDERAISKRGPMFGEEELQFIFSIEDEVAREEYLDLMVKLRDQEELARFVQDFSNSIKVSLTFIFASVMPGYIFMPGIRWPKTAGWFFQADKLSVLFGLPPIEDEIDYLNFAARGLTIVNNDDLLLSLAKRVGRSLERLGQNVETIDLAGQIYEPRSASDWETMALFVGGLTID